MKLHVKKGDKVKILSGKDRGKTGKVTRALPKKEKVIVEGVNVMKKHQRSNKRDQKGQIIDRAMPIHISNVQKVSNQKK